MRIEEVKGNMERKVTYREQEYYLTGCTLRKTLGKFYYQAELTDLTGRSVSIVPLERVISEKPI